MRIISLAVQIIGWIAIALSVFMHIANEKDGMKSFPREDVAVHSRNRSIAWRIFLLGVAVLVFGREVIPWIFKQFSN